MDRIDQASKPPTDYSAVVFLSDVEPDPRLYGEEVVAKWRAAREQSREARNRHYENVRAKVEADAAYLEQRGLPVTPVIIYCIARRHGGSWLQWGPRDQDLIEEEREVTKRALALLDLRNQTLQADQPEPAQPPATWPQRRSIA
jgi:hypothetical protein